MQNTLFAHLALNNITDSIYLDFTHSAHINGNCE